MDWLRQVELRARARVPIINLFHLNSVECDVSIGLAARDTSELVKDLKERCGPALFVLSALLKVFLNQLDLDKPFTGGSGLLQTLPHDRQTPPGLFSRVPAATAEL